MIIAINGEKQSGKDTVGAIFQWLCSPHIHPYYRNDFTEFIGLTQNERNSFSYWQIEKFANKVNDCFKLIFNIDFLSLEGEEKEKYRTDFRNLAEGMKDLFGRDIWAKTLFKNYIYNSFPVIGQGGDNIFQDNNNFISNWIITDLRFKEELNIIKQFFPFITIKIINNVSSSKDNHISEIDLFEEKFDYIIYNDKKDLHTLYNKIFIIKKEIEKKLGYKLDYII